MERPVAEDLAAEEPDGVDAAAGPAARVVSVALSSDGTRVVTATDGKLTRIWDAVTGALLAPPFEHHAVVQSVAVSPDGRRVVIAGGDSAQLWTPPVEQGSLADWEAVARSVPRVTDDVLGLREGAPAGSGGP